ncbi:hypothetical protein [Streptomyces sp. Inha503]|uniref:hypothetical protein n=1 Tax=Streptomyces sp. Inha503 TaxID=3383314 RepID=UPI0039A37D93
MRAPSLGETTTELNKVAEIAARTPKLRLVVGMDTAPSALPPELDSREHDIVGFLPLAHVVPALLLIFTS